MRARIVLVLLFVVVTCFKLLGCEGHNTYRLIKSVTLVDPPVENYKQVYLENDSKIILDYTVGKRPKEMGRNYGPPGHHWAELASSSLIVRTQRSWIIKFTGKDLIHLVETSSGFLL